MKILNFKSVVTAIALALVSISTAQAAQTTVTIKVSPAQQAAAAAYWSSYMISSAPIFPMPIDYGDPGIDTSFQALAVPSGPARSTPAGAASPNANLKAMAEFPQAWSALEDNLALEGSLAANVAAPVVPTGTAGVYTFYDVNTQTALWNIYPHKWDGKLTFSVPGGGSSCSATVISGNNIVTAAHCVYDTANNRWYSNWVFTPAYRNGSAPFGTFTASACTILTNWINLSGSFSINSWTRYDVAVCTLNKNSAGQTINGAVGWAGRLWNVGYQQLVFNSGYPAKNYNLATITGPAQYLRSCTDETFAQTTDTLGGGCYWGPGISGGSWLVGYKPFVVTGQVNSVNSGLFVGQQNIYGIRFTSSNIVPVCTARRC